MPPLRADLAIFLETHLPRYRWVAPRRWLVPNPECWNSIHDRDLVMYERVLAKTRSAAEAFAARAPGRVSLVGWLTRQLPAKLAARRDAFLHVAGSSPFKGTASVLHAWTHHRVSLPLTVVAWGQEERAVKIAAQAHPAIRHIGRVSDDEIEELRRTHWFALQPSQAEGWGHVLGESVMAGCVLITTDGAPMNELPDGTILVPAARTSPMKAGVSHDVAPEVLADTVKRAADLSFEQRECMVESARAARARAHRAAEAALQELVDGPSG
ncbi:hypothetical protein DBR42_10905 [Pelomonas sp. HMWF004]|nr:hypothetical protein DBR42_10905 [Pelomonas sp. HMWF004]